MRLQAPAINREPAATHENVLAHHQDLLPPSAGSTILLLAKERALRGRIHLAVEIGQLGSIAMANIGAAVIVRGCRF